MPHTSFPIRRATSVVLALAALAACRKPAPEEQLVPFGTAMPTGGSGSGPSGGTSGGGSGGGAGTRAGTGGTGGSTGAGTSGAGTSGGESGSGGSRPGDGMPDGGVPSEPLAFSKPALLEAAGECVLAHASDFEQRAEALVTATQAYADDRSEDTLDAARAAWLDAMQTWQRLEVMRIGPAAAASKPGGQSLRDQIYAFPLANPCLVDRQTVSESYEQAGFTSSLTSGRGLAAIEYLLFYGGASNSCAPQVDINANGTWGALSADELAQRRADYAAAAAVDVRNSARALHEAWDPTEEDFVQQLARAGEGGSVYGTQQLALDALNEALFYVDKELKDYKLGWPLGLVPECVNAPSTCPTEVESRYAQASTDHIRQNLIGFRRLFVGCGASDYGLGFDDWLREEGEDELADRMIAALDAALAEVDALDPPLEQAIYAVPPSKVSALHTAIKAITNPLKTELVTVLNISLPATAQGDND